MKGFQVLQHEAGISKAAAASKFVHQPSKGRCFKPSTASEGCLAAAKHLQPTALTHCATQC